MIDLPDGAEILGVEDDIGGLSDIPEGAQVIQDEGFNPLDLAQRGLDVGASYAKGLGFGGTPKIAAGVGAAVAKPILEVGERITGNQAPTYGELYQSGVDMYSAPQNRAALRDSTLAGVAEIGGALTGGVGMAGTKTAQGLQKVISGAPIQKAMPMAEKAMRLFGKSARAGIAGEAGYRAYKVGEAESGQELQELTSGAPVGLMMGAGMPIAGVAAKAGIEKARPKIAEGFGDVVGLAKKHNIPLSIDQISGSRALSNVQKISQQLPFSGVGDFRDNQMKAFNKALIKTFGQEGESFTPELMNKSFKNLGKQFDDFGKGKTFSLDDNFKNYVTEILDDARSTTTNEAVDKLSKEIDNVFKNADEGEIKGEALGFIRNRINRLGRKSKIEGLGELYRDLESGVIDVMTQGDLAAKESFKQLKKEYKNLLAIEPLAVKAKGGNISPTLLNNRVSKIYGRQFTRGKAGELGDLAQVGRQLLGELGGSDTAEKMLYTGAATGVGFLEPTTTIAGLGLNKAYQKYINQNQKIIQKTLEREFLSKHAPDTLEKGVKYIKEGIE